MADELETFYQNVYKPKMAEIDAVLAQYKSQYNMLEEKVRKLSLRQTRVENTVS